MTALHEPLKGNSTPEPLVYEALEFIMSERVIMSSKYPRGICAVCNELLKISYDLKIQYYESEKNLKEELYKLGEISEGELSNELNTGKEKKDKPLVEIVVGSKSFNIHDLLIVEEEEEEEDVYNGFLKNLGKSVTASFVGKEYKKPKLSVEDPSLVIEKIICPAGIGENSTREDHAQTRQYTYAESTGDNDEGNHEDNDAEDDVFLDTPVDDDTVKKLVSLGEVDKDIIETAMTFKYKCPHCQKPMYSLKKARLHSRRCDKNTLNVTCYVCRAKFGFRKQLLTHLKQVHLVGTKKADQTKGTAIKYQCTVCEEIFNSNGSLSYHMSKHLGRQHACDICDKLFFTKSQVKNHRKIHNRDATVVMCPICGKSFHYQSGLFYHMKMHTNERNYHCSFCPRRFYTRNSLKRHELTHTGGRPYACNFCDKRFRSLGEVKKHKRLHTGERPFNCKYCGMAFIQAHNLKMHLMTHPGDFHCVHCSKGFVEKDVLRFHLQNKHKGIQEEENIAEEEQEEEEIIQQNDDTLEDQDETIGEEGTILEEVDQEEEYFITEEYMDEEPSLVQDYEVPDDVLVETVEENLQ